MATLSKKRLFESVLIYEFTERIRSSGGSTPCPLHVAACGKADVTHCERLRSLREFAPKRPSQSDSMAAKPRSAAGGDSSILNLLICISGIYICYLSYGIFQEKMCATLKNSSGWW
jgi:hypothetical protein